MDEHPKKIQPSSKDKIFNVRKLHYKNYEHDKYNRPHFAPFFQKEGTSEKEWKEQKIKKGGEYNFQVAIISSAAYKELNRRYCHLKEEQQKEKDKRMKELREKEEELLKYEAEKQRLDAERQRLTKKRDEIKIKLDHLRNRNQSLRMEQVQRNEQYRMMNMEYLRNLVMSMRYQNGIEIDPDNMTYEELLQLEEKIGNVSKGISQEQLEKLHQKPCEAEGVCSICYEDVKKGDPMVYLPCTHGFHHDCIKEWLLKEKVCPMCKQQII